MIAEGSTVELLSILTDAPIEQLNEWVRESGETLHALAGKLNGGQFTPKQRVMLALTLEIAHRYAREFAEELEPLLREPCDSNDRMTARALVHRHMRITL